MRFFSFFYISLFVAIAQNFCCYLSIHNLYIFQIKDLTLLDIYLFFKQSGYWIFYIFPKDKSYICLIHTYISSETLTDIYYYYTLIFKILFIKNLIIIVIYLVLFFLLPFLPTVKNRIIFNLIFH